MSDRQTILDRLDTTPADAIHLCDLQPLRDGTRPISVSMQRRVLQFFGGFKSDRCWLPIAEIAKQLCHDERTVRAAIRVLVAEQLLVESGHRNRRTRAVNWGEIGLRINRSEDGSLPCSTGQDAQPGTGQLVAGCPDEPGTAARPTTEPGEQSSPSSRREPRPTTAKILDSGWEPAAEALRAVGLAHAAKAIELAKAAGMQPSELVDLAAIVRHDSRLSPGSIIARLRDGCWPVDDVVGIEGVQQARRRRAEKIRQARHDDAETAPQRPQGWVVDGLVGRDLRRAGLADLATDAEEQAADRMDEVDRLRADRLQLA
ncbi:hypothetical protein [Rosistilla oblonga]|uniref:hypothetical protein n=1 Tax=Rosistilla oblonga TaxID=2527990 RepID=UPI003A983AA8